MNRLSLPLHLWRTLLAAVLLAVATLAQAVPTLRVLAWPGYADPEVVRDFEARTHSRVEISFIDTDAALWQKISHGEAQDFDVFAVNTAELQRYIRRGWVLGIDTKAIPNLARQLPRFRDLAAIPGLVHGGKPYAVPYTYSEMGLIYDRRQVASPPDSIAVLWDERYRGKVLAYDGGTHSFSLAAQVLGLKSPFQLGEGDWLPAVERLVALRRNVAAFYTQPDESVALFKSRQAALLFANYGTQQLQALRAAGLDVGYAIPKEGALAWLDCWAITRGAKDTALAHAWINHLLEQAPGELLTTRQGLANTTVAAPGVQPGARLTWLEPVESEERRNRLWGRIVSGDRAARVLAP